MSKKLVITLFFLILFLTATVALADSGEEGVPSFIDPSCVIYFAAVVIAAGLAIGIAAHGTGIGMGNAIKGAVDGVSRNPDTYGRILTTMMIGLAMIESLAIYALVIALILLFVNPFAELFLKIAAP